MARDQVVDLTAVAWATTGPGAPALRSAPPIPSPRRPLDHSVLGGGPALPSWDELGLPGDTDACLDDEPMVRRRDRRADRQADRRADRSPGRSTSPWLWVFVTVLVLVAGATGYFLGAASHSGELVRAKSVAATAEQSRASTAQQLLVAQQAQANAESAAAQAEDTKQQAMTRATASQAPTASASSARDDDGPATADAAGLAGGDDSDTPGGRTQDGGGATNSPAPSADPSASAPAPGDPGAPTTSGETSAEG